MEYVGIALGLMGFSIALGAYYRLDKLEKKLREKNILEKEWKSE